MTMNTNLSSSQTVLRRTDSRFLIVRNELHPMIEQRQNEKDIRDRKDGSKVGQHGRTTRVDLSDIVSEPGEIGSDEERYEQESLLCIKKECPTKRTVKLASSSRERALVRSEQAQYYHWHP